MEMKKFLIFLLLSSLVLIAGCVKEEKGFRLEGKSILMIIAHKNFRDEEFQKPYDIFTDSGAKVTIASSSLEEAIGMLGKKVKPDILLEDVNVEEYDAIIFVGGSGATEYFEDPAALQIAKQAYEKGKIIGAICIAPSILANAGILEGRRATSYVSEKSNLEAHGAIFTGKNVEVDGNIVTANGPHAAKKFGETIAELLQS